MYLNTIEELTGIGLTIVKSLDGHKVIYLSVGVVYNQNKHGCVSDSIKYITVLYFDLNGFMVLVRVNKVGYVKTHVCHQPPVTDDVNDYPQNCFGV